MQSMYLYSLYSSAFFTEELSVILHNEVHFHKYIVQIFVTAPHWFCNPFSLRAVILLWNVQYFGEQKVYMAFKFLLWSFRLKSLKSFYILLLMVYSLQMFFYCTLTGTIKTPLLWLLYLKIMQWSNTIFYRVGFFFPRLNILSFSFHIRRGKPLRSSWSRVNKNFA